MRQTKIQQEVESHYQAMIVWQPEAGFAILGYYEGLQGLNVNAEANVGIFESPEVRWQV
ncbi:MAG: hypothetical protein R2880_18285 [Deinococcales bacterium]